VLNTKKVLIITYYWPPGGGAGVQRWLKFAKYLPQFGWTPVIYTPQNGEMPVIDASLDKDILTGTEVIKTKIWEPYSLYKKFIGVGKDEKINTGFLTEKTKPGMAEQISVWLRGNLFIPDARCFWVKPSVKYLSEYIKKNKIHAIISTGPPHSMHLIALELSQKFKLPWIADFRDPWTNIDYYRDLKLTSWADKKHHALEKKVVTNATRVVVVGNQMKMEFEQAFGRKVDLITNGFDEDDVTKQLTPPINKFTIAHVGTLVRSRNPVALWKALAHLTKSDHEFGNILEIRLTGKVDIEVRNSIIAYELEKYVTYIDYLPHNKVISEQQNASVLLLILNNTPNAKGILTGKMFEYLAAKRPILCVGPTDGDAAKIISETQSGQTFNFDDEKTINHHLQELFNQFQTGNLNINSSGVEKYSRKALTGELVTILEEISKPKDFVCIYKIKD